MSYPLHGFKGPNRESPALGPPIAKGNENSSHSPKSLSAPLLRLPPLRHIPSFFLPLLSASGEPTPQGLSRTGRDWAARFSSGERDVVSLLFPWQSLGVGLDRIHHTPSTLGYTTLQVPQATPELLGGYQWPLRSALNRPSGSQGPGKQLTTFLAGQ